MYTPCVGLALIVGISVNDYYNSHGQLFKWMIILFALWFVFSSVLLWQYNKVSYIEAGRVVRDVDRVLYENTLNIDHGDMIIVVDLPWLWNGAHFAPNGYSAYLQEIHQKWQLNLTYIEKGEEGISQAWLDRLQEAKFKRYYVFLWNKDRQILEPVVTY
jgi:ABC-type multidrug transport system fused ATPase/permease subunit